MVGSSCSSCGCAAVVVEEVVVDDLDVDETRLEPAEDATEVPLLPLAITSTPAHGQRAVAA
jgi:hypothetical protein